MLLRKEAKLVGPTSSAIHAANGTRNRKESANIHFLMTTRGPRLSSLLPSPSRNVGVAGEGSSYESFAVSSLTSVYLGGLGVERVRGLPSTRHHLGRWKTQGNHREGRQKAMMTKTTGIRHAKSPYCVYLDVQSYSPT